MSGQRDVEFADRRRGTDFPPEWGSPPGSPYSEERASWVLTHVRKHVGDPIRRLEKLQVLRLNDLRRELVSRRMAEGKELERLLAAAGYLAE